MFDVLLVFNDWALLLLRLVFAAIFLVHGWPKLKNLATTQQNFAAMGFKPGWLWGTLIAFLEAIGGLFVLLGIGVQLFALLFTIQMLVATVWKMKKGQGLAGGYELDLLLVVSGLVLATSGNGLFSLGFLLGF